MIRILTLAAIAGAIGIFAYYAIALFLKYPPVWPDEALYANPAINLVRRGVMASESWPGLLQGTERHTYIAPPLYFLYVAAWFRLWGIGVIVMRLSSVAAGAVVMVATYFLGQRSGLGSWLSLLPPSLLAIDSVFLRASLLGRPDMLCSAFILLTLLMATRVSPSTGLRTTTTSFLVGIFGGMAMATHLTGATALLAVVAAGVIAHRRGERFHGLLPTLGGLAAALIPWAIYVFQDRKSFLAQTGSEVFKRVTPQAFTPTGWIHIAAMSLLQYGLPVGLLAGLMWGAGLAGLCYAVRERRDLWVLPICLIFLLPMMTAGEYWYPVYLLPLTTLGVIHLARGAEVRPSRSRIDAALTLALIVCFVVGNILHLSNLRAASKGSENDYNAWCEQVSAHIPRGSKVLVSVIPDPYFGLLTRPDLKVREFFPIRMPIDPETYSRYMGDADYIIVGPSTYPSPAVADFASTQGQWVATVGEASRGAYCARIYKRGNGLPTSHE